MSTTDGIAKNGYSMAGWPLPAHFGSVGYHEQVAALLGAEGADLARRSREAQDQLRALLGSGGFTALDACLSAVMDAACARESAVAAVCYGLGLGAGRAGEHAQLGEDVVGAALSSGLTADAAAEVATAALTIVTTHTS